MTEYYKYVTLEPIRPRIRELEAENKALQAERDELVKALKPFAQTLQGYSGFTEYTLFGIWEDVNGAAWRKLNILRHPDFKKAQALVEELDNE